MPSVVYAKAVILDEQGRVLLLRRSSTDDHRPGDQDYPGGKIEQGEEFAAGVAREITEETGLHIHAVDLKLLYAQTHWYEPKSVTQLLFWGRSSNTQVMLSDEHDAYNWVTPEQALINFPHPFYGVGLEYALKHKLFDGDSAA